MNRRTYLVTAGVTASSLLTGCIGTSTNDGGTGDGSGSATETSSGNETETTSATTSDESDDGTMVPTDIIDTYLSAAKDEDVDTLSEVVHSSSPLQSALDGGNVMFKFADSGPRTSSTVAVADASASDILELEFASQQFEKSELADTIEGSDVMMVDVELEDAKSNAPGTWVLATENGDWRVFWIGKNEQAPANLDEMFDEPIKDTDGTVVDRIEYNSSQENTVDVHLTESPGVEADIIRVESTVEGHVAEFDGSWSDSWVAVPIHPEGDQIVVTVVKDGTEEVVHRVHFEP